MSVTIEIPISGELCRDLIVTAIEGGINYWADEAQLLDPNGKRLSTSKWLDAEGWPEDGTKVRIHTDGEDEPAEWYEIDLAAIKKGLDLMREKGAHHFRNLFGETSWDAETADAFVQYCIFNEHRYG